MGQNTGKFFAAGASAAVAIVLIVAAPGCSEECVDSLDCRGRGSAGQSMVCENNRCVPGTRPGADGGQDAGGTMDGGSDGDDAGADAGAEDAGADAGLEDGGTVGDDAGMSDAATVFSANLEGAQEVPPNPSTATGTGSFNVVNDGSAINYNITHNVVGATSAHIHRAHAGRNGGVVFNLGTPTPVMMGTIPLDGGVTLEDLRQGRLYVNVHSPMYMGGEIRGQIIQPDELLFSAQLDGGTSSGSAGIIVNPAAQTLLWEVTLNNVTGAAAAHIHHLDGGGIIFPLPGITDDGGFGIGTVDPDGGVVQALNDNEAYINVHDSTGAVIITGETTKLE